MISDDKARTCYLAALPGPQSDALVSRLRAKGVVCLRADLVRSSMPFFNSVKSALSRSDFVSCILPADPSPNVMFELGIAIGLGKPLLLFAEDTLKLPFDLISSRALKADSISSEGLDSYLEAFLRTITPSSTKKRTSKREPSHRRSSFWRELRSELSGAHLTDDRGARFEELLTRAFEEAGLNPTPSPGPDFGADFAITSPALNGAFGLPILVQAKASSSSVLQQSTVEKLAQLLREKRGGAGIIVTSKETGARTTAPQGLPIVVVSANDLFEWLQKGSFADNLLMATDELRKRPH